MLLSVAPERFREQLDALLTLGEVVPLADLVRLRGRPGSRVAITFDDGYRDNLSAAKPVLTELGLPATVFVASSLVGSRSEAWWDEIERMLLSPGLLPSQFTLRVGRRILELDMGDDAAYDARRAAADAGWSVLDARDPSARHRVYRRLAVALKPIGAAEREEALAALAAIADPGTLAPRPERAFVDAEELRALAGGGIEIGAHTRTHAALLDLAADEREQEIDGSRSDLEEILGARPTAFAYPYGSASRARRLARVLRAPAAMRADAGPRAARQVRKLGFASACTTSRGVVDGRSDPWLLPRLLVRNWSGDEFASRLRVLLAGEVRGRRP
jgi:peptidoglycan/xylan/chitin deacetylase (PgdA/CDA1 family)